MESFIVTKKKTIPFTIMLNESVTIEQISSLKSQFLDAINNNDITVVDISEVSFVDITFLQLLLSAEQEALLNNKQFFVKKTFSAQVLQLINSLAIKIPLLPEELNV